MPAPLTYPGVYVEEIPSGVRPITGVATSITAFVGRALRGPVDGAITITSYADFERIYGGLWLESSLGYAVSDFYRNGGSTAIVVRVHKTKANDTAGLSLGSGVRQVALVAASPGAWGSKLSAEIDNLVKDSTDTTLFNLTVTDTGTGKTESFRNVSFAVASPRRVDLVLAAESTLVRSTGSLPTSPQSSFPVTATATNGNDGDPVDAALYTTGANLRTDKKGLYALENADLVNLLVIPPYTLDRRDRRAGAHRHDRVRGGAAGGRGHGPAGRLDEPRQRRHRRLGRVVHRQQERGRLLPARQPAGRAPRRTARPPWLPRARSRA